MNLHLTSFLGFMQLLSFSCDCLSSVFIQVHTDDQRNSWIEKGNKNDREKVSMHLNRSKSAIGVRRPIRRSRRDFFVYLIPPSLVKIAQARFLSDRGLDRMLTSNSGRYNSNVFDFKTESPSGTGHTGTGLKSERARCSV